MTQAVSQNTAADGVRRAGIIAQKIKPGADKRVLNTFPKNHEVAGIHAYADDPGSLGLCTLLKKPADGRGFAVAHRRDHCGHAAARYGPQALLQALGYVDRVQAPLLLRHGKLLCINAKYYIGMRAAAQDAIRRLWLFKSLFLCYNTLKHRKKGGV